MAFCPLTTSGENRSTLAPIRRYGRPCLRIAWRSTGSLTPRTAQAGRVEHRREAPAPVRPTIRLPGRALGRGFLVLMSRHRRPPGLPSPAPSRRTGGWSRHGQGPVSPGVRPTASPAPRRPQDAPPGGATGRLVAWAAAGGWARRRTRPTTRSPRVHSGRRPRRAPSPGRSAGGARHKRRRPSPRGRSGRGAWRPTGGAAQSRAPGPPDRMEACEDGSGARRGESDAQCGEHDGLQRDARVDD
jgi:hypothetical protein